jgi:hypothetical protein
MTGQEHDDLCSDHHGPDAPCIIRF